MNGIIVAFETTLTAEELERALSTFITTSATESLTVADSTALEGALGNMQDIHSIVVFGDGVLWPRSGHVKIVNAYKPERWRS